MLIYQNYMHTINRLDLDELQRNINNKTKCYVIHYGQQKIIRALSTIPKYYTYFEYALLLINVN